MYNMIVAYMMVYFIYILLSNSCQGYSRKKWLRIPRNRLPLGYFYANMGAYTPQSASAGVFLCKYGRLYPAVSSHRGIFSQIWVPVPRSQLSSGYFRANMVAYTPQPTFTGVFLRKYGYLSPALLPLTETSTPHLQILSVPSIPL